MIHGDACFAYFNKIWGIPKKKRGAFCSVCGPLPASAAWRWPEFKARVQAAYQAPSRSIARELAAGVVADYGREQECGVECFVDDLEACIAHLQFPVTHSRAIRTTNPLERLFVEERRHLKIIPNAFRACLRCQNALRSQADPSLHKETF